MFDHDVEHETVELRFRQRIRAFELDRVLSREDKEGLIEGIGATLDRDLVLLHRFEKGRLRLGRCAVDLVGKQDIGEDRPRREDHMPPPRFRIVLDDIGAGDVRRHQVGCELDSGELEIQDVGHGLNNQRLGQPRHANDQAISSDKQGQQHLVDDGLLSDDDFPELRNDLLPARVHSVGQHHIIRRFEIHCFVLKELHGSSGGWYCDASSR